MAKATAEAPESIAPPDILNAAPRKVEETVSMSLTELAALIAQMNNAAEERASKDRAALVDALLKSREPYKDPKAEENERKFRENMRLQEEKKRRSVYATQQWCEHIAGSLGDVQDPGHRLSIVWHMSDINEVVGICTTCQRIFRETDEDYAKWRTKKSFNKMSKSGEGRYIENRELAKRVR